MCGWKRCYNCYWYSFKKTCIALSYLLTTNRSLKINLMKHWMHVYWKMELPLQDQNMDRLSNMIFERQRLLHYVSLTQFRKPQSVCKRDKMPILSMVLGSKDTLWATTSISSWELHLTQADDGACFHWDYKNDTMLCNLSGPNYDPLYDIAVYNRDIYTVSRDGFVRKYFV